MTSCIGRPRTLDIDDNFRFIRSVNYPSGNVRSAIASDATGHFYISSERSGGTIIKIDLENDNIVWTKTYSDGVDSGRSVLMDKSYIKPQTRMDYGMSLIHLVVM